MILAITGGRKDGMGRVLIPSRAQVEAFLSLITRLGISALHHGDAMGTDRYVALITSASPRSPIGKESVHKWPVDTRIDGPWPLAGHNRNRRMLTLSGAQGLIAFPGATGTQNCTECALELGLRVWRWQGDREHGEFKEITAQ